MKIQNAVRKIEKHTGSDHLENGMFHTFKYNGEVIEIMAQKGNVSTISVKNENDESDPMTDYFPETYCDNVSQALRLIGAM